MLNKLKDLTVTKVALVKEGDNKGADILIFKSKDDAPAEPEQNTESTMPITEKESNVLKQILFGIGKALGFVDSESVQSKPLEKTNNVDGIQPPEIQKGVTDVKIDKSKLTAEELAALEAIEKKAGIPDNISVVKDALATVVAPETILPEHTAGDEDIYKGLHPAIKAELMNLRKQADAAAERELTDIAKKYELIGKKPEELVPVLKSLKAAGGDAYDQMITILDASLEAVEKSGIFSEIGKRGNGESDAWATIEKHAGDILKAAPELTLNQAIDKACEQHPELVEEYEKQKEEQK